MEGKSVEMMIGRKSYKIGKKTIWDQREEALKEAQTIVERPTITTPHGRQRGLKEWLRAQAEEHVIARFKILGYGEDADKVLEGWKNVNTGKTIFTKLRRATAADKLTHGIKKWGKKLGVYVGDESLGPMEE